MAHRAAPQDPDFAARVRASFAQQSLMSTIGASLELVEPGEVHIALPFSPALSQQHGYEVLAVEFKINLLAPAKAPRLLARGRVLRAGRRLTVCLAEVLGVEGVEHDLVATMLSTISARPSGSSSASPAQGVVS